MFVGNAELSWEDLGKLFTTTYTALLAGFFGFVSANWGDHNEDLYESDRLAGYKIKDDDGFQAAYEVGHAKGLDIGYERGRLMSNATLLFDLRNTYLEIGFLPILHYIHQIIHVNRGKFFCTDPRDAFYGLNGLCRASSLPPLSYDKSEVEVFRVYGSFDPHK